MKLRCLGLAFFGLAALFLVPDTRVAGQDGEKKVVSLKVHVPNAEAKLTIDGVATKQSGSLRTFKSPALDTKSTYTYTLKALWEPNNYTKITRIYKVKVNPAKDKELEVDMRVVNPDIKDEIVVRYVPTPNEVVDAMCKLAKVGKNDVVYDLGCGDGRMVIRAVDKFEAKRGVGVEIDPKLVKESTENGKLAKVDDRVEFRQGDVLKIDDIPDASVVLLYMGEDINKRLKPILKAKLKPGSRVVSHRFLMGDDWPPYHTETVMHDGDEYLIHLWIIGEEKKKKE